MNTGCSSSSDSGEDLDISEIKEIETTGEFSEDEFFSADDGIATEETKLVDEVAGLDEEISEEVAGLEDGLSDELQLEEVADGAADEVFALEGADVLDELNLDEGSPIGDNQDVSVSAEDLGFEDGEDIFGDETAGQETAAASADELDLDSEDDLFRDDTTPANDVVANESDLLGVENDEFFSDSGDAFTEEEVSTPGFVSTDSGDVAASQILTEDVSIDDIDYSDQIASSDKSASQLLDEDDVSIDVDYSNSGASTVASNSEKTYIPVKKMQTVPYSKNGVLVNAIYFVRSGDSLADIGSKIYGNGSAVDFRIVNPHLRPGALKVGQKVYYNSPNRSQDRSRLLTYYEDVRMPAQTYSASAGENIRKISENLLGHPRSWMEVWASNQQVQEKWALEAPQQIRYWQGNQAPAPTLARVTPPPAPRIEPAAPKAVEVARQEEASSQASINLDEPEMAAEEDIFDDPVVADQDSMDEPDMELDEPAEVVAAQDEDIFDDVIEDEPAAPAVVNNNNPGEDPSVAAVDGRGIARNKGGFPAKAGGLMDSDMIRKGIIGGALLLLLVVGFLVVRRRRQSQNAIEMESFDFGGDTTIDDAQDKTQIDL